MNKASYYPFSLLSCLGKLMERMVNKSHLYYLKKNNLLDKGQSGLRKCRSMVDQTNNFTQKIEDAIQTKSN